MSNSLKLQVLLNAVDKASRPFKAVQDASKALSGEVRDSQQQIKNLNAQAGKIEHFRKASAQLATTSRALEKAKADATALAVAFRSTANPTRAQAKALEEARRCAAELQTQHNSLRLSVQQQRNTLQQAGISTRNLSGAERQLRGDIERATATLNQQRDALARVSQQQERLNRVRQRHERGREMTAGVRNAGAAALGAGTGALYVGARLMAPQLQAEEHGAKIAAQSGEDSAKGTEYSRIIKDINSSGISADINQIADAVSSVRSTLGALGNIGDAELDRITRKALDMQAVLGGDVAESIQLAAIMMKNGLAASSDEALDLISTGMQRVSTQMRGELPEILHEYSTHFRNLGFSEKEAMSLLVDMAQQGKFALDKTGDAIKEFSIRGSDMSKSSIEAYDAAGLNAAKMSTAIASGGDKARAAMQKTAKGLLKIKDPAERANAAIALFGTPIEDLSIDQIPKFLSALAGTADKLGDVSGTADRMGDTLRDNLTGDLARLNGALASLRFDVFSGADGPLRQLTQSSTQWLTTAGQWIKTNPELVNKIVLATGAITGLVAVLGGIGLVVWPVMTGINALVAGAGLLSTGFSLAGGVMAGAIGALSLPIAGVVAVFAGVIAAVVAGALLIRKYWEPIGAFFDGVVEGLKTAFAPVAELFAPLKPVFDWLGERLAAAWEWFKRLVAPVKATQDTLNSCCDAGVAFGQMLADALTMPFKALTQLRAGIDWVLEKLGIIDNKSDKLGDKVQPQPGADTMLSQPPSAAALKMGVINAPAPQGNSAQAIAARYSGAYDSGGAIPLGKFAVVGEHGPEIVNGPATVTSRRETAAMATRAMTMTDYRPVTSQTQVNSTTAPITIHAPISVIAQPGQSAQEIVREVMRQLESIERRARSRTFSRYAIDEG